MKAKKLNRAKTPYLDADVLRLMRLVEVGQYADVERVSRDYLARFPKHPLALRALSFALVGQRRFEEVVPVADFALRHAPDDSEIRNNRAIALAELMRWDEAIPEFQSALKLLPGDFEIHRNLGVAYFRLHRWNEAVASLLKAIELHPHDYVDAMETLALSLICGRRFDEAALVCRSLYDAAPQDMEALNRVVNVAFYRSDWADLDQKLSQLAPWFVNSTSVFGPWELHKYWCTSMAVCREVAERFGTSRNLHNIVGQPPVLPMTWRPGARKLRVAYMSSDLGDHAVGYVIAELIEQHDREKLEVFAYSLRGNDSSQQRSRLMNGFDYFVDVSKLSVRDTAERIRADEIDILVDLNGWTSNCRAEALALRCAPIQVNWLGYAGTMGLPCLADYVVGDPVATPLDYQPWFSERIVQMPNSYMPADTTRRIATVPSRKSQGLPDAAFVICSFNSNYKFNPPLFDLWCSFLREMPDAVLWLPCNSDTVATNLKREFVNRGVASERLILAERVDSPEDHLGRLQLADLALDTFPYNSHSTGVDVLWAGVPMVAKRGDTFAGRVGASLLRAVGLPELIASDDVGYADLVVQLYHDRARLAGLRERLKAARKAAPLFDMIRFARDLEALYFDMAKEKSGDLAEIDAAALPVPATEA